MLQSMRENLKGVVAYVLVGLIIVIFALFGAEALFMGGLTQDTVAEVNGRKVSELDVRRAVEIRKQQLRQMLGDNIDPRFLSDEFLLPSIRESVIQQEVLVSAAEDSGLRISTAELDKAIVEDSTFHRDGKFDPEYYKSLLRQYGYTPASYRDELRTRQLLSQYQAAYLGTTFVTPKAIAEMARLQFETRSFSVATLPLARVLPGIELADADVAAYYEQHQDDFMSEAQAAVEYVMLNRQALHVGLVVSEEDIVAQYEEEVKQAGDSTERQAAHILIEEKSDGSHLALLSDLQKKISAGEDFGKLAKAHSADSGSAAQGGDVGTTTGNSFVAEFEDALKSLKVGQVSEPVKTQFGYHLIKLLAEKKAPVPTLEQSRGRISQQLRSQLADERYTEMMEGLRQMAPGAQSLEAVATELGANALTLPVRKTALFSRSNPMPLLAVDPALRHPQVLEAVFSKESGVGHVTDVLELNDNISVVLRITEWKPAEVQPLEVVKARVTAEAQRARASEQLGLRANELLQKLLAGESLENVARAEKIPVQAFRDKGRQDASIDAELLAKAFTLRKASDSAVSADVLARDSGDLALVVLHDSKSPAVELLTAAQRSEVLERLQGNSRNGEFSALMAMLTDEAKIVRRKQTDSEAR